MCCVDGAAFWNGQHPTNDLVLSLDAPAFAVVAVHRSLSVAAAAAAPEVGICLLPLRLSRLGPQPLSVLPRATGRVAVCNGGHGCSSICTYVAEHVAANAISTVTVVGFQFTLLG